MRLQFRSEAGDGVEEETARVPWRSLGPAAEPNDPFGHLGPRATFFSNLSKQLFIALIMTLSSPRLGGPFI